MTVFEFDDYRKFLKHRIHELRAQDSHFSKGYFAEVCGFTGAYLSMVLNGKRNLTDPMITKMSEFLDLKTAEQKFFRLLVKLNQAQNPEERLTWARQIMASKGFQKHHPLSNAQYRYFSKWYYPVILEYIGTHSVRQNLSNISQAFREQIPEKELAQALRDLRDLGLVRTDSQGIWRAIQGTVVTAETVHSPFLTDYYRQILSLAATSLLETHEDFREISGLTFSLSPQKVEKVKQIVRNFHKELFAVLENEPPGDLVYHMTFALFPFSKTEDPD